VRTAIGPNSRPGLDIIRYVQTSDARGPAVIRDHARWTPAPAATAFAMVEPVVALRGAYRISFAYAGADRIWQSTWQNRPQLPRQIRVMVIDADSQRS